MAKPLHHNKAVIYEEGSHILYTHYIYIYTHTHTHTHKSFSTTLDEDLKKSIKKKKDGEIRKHKQDKMWELNMK